MAYVQSAANPSAGGTVSATLGAAPTSGNLLVAYVSQQSTNVWTAASGWTALTKATSSDEGGLFYKVAGAGESTTQSPCTTANTARKWVCIVAEYDSIDTTSPLLAESAIDAAGSNPMTSPQVTPTAGVPALVIGAAFSTSATTTFSGQMVNGSATGVTERQDVGSGSGGNQTSGCLWDLSVASTSGTYQTTAAASVLESSGISIAVFKGASAGGASLTVHNSRSATRATEPLLTTSTPGTLTQGAWRWYADEATPGTALAGENVAPVLDGDAMREGIVRLRVAVNSAGLADAGKVASLQYSYDGTNWNIVQEATPILNQEGWWFRYANGASTAGDPLAGTLLTGSTEAGHYHESGTTPTESITADGVLELDFAVRSHWPPPDTTVLFRVIWDGTPLTAATPISLTTSSARERGRAITRLDPDGSQKTTREIRFAPWPRIFYDGTYWWFFTVYVTSPTIIRSFYWRGAGSDWIPGATVDITDASHQSRHAFAFKVVAGVPTVYVHAGQSSSTRRVVKGTISGHTLTWGAVQTVTQSSDRHRHICVTDDGHLWIVGTTAGSGVWARRSTNVDDVTAWGAAKTASDTAMVSGNVIAALGLGGDKALLVWQSGTVLKWATVTEAGGFSTVGQVNATTEASGEDWGWARTGGSVYLVHSDSNASGGTWVLRVFDEAGGTWSTGASPGVTGQPSHNDGIAVTLGDDGAIYAVGTLADTENGQDRKLGYVRYSGGAWGPLTDVATSLGSRGNGDHVAAGVQGGGQVVIAFAFNDDDQATNPRTAEFHTIPTTTRTLPQPARGGFYYAWYDETWTVGGSPTKWTPTLGNYDLDGDPADAVFDQHIAWVEYAGMDFLIVSWWGQDDWNDNLTGSDHNEGTRLARFANRLTANGSPVKFCAYYESEGFGDPSIAQLQSDLAYIKDRYATHPNYLWRNGKPVIFVYNSGDDSTTNCLQRWSDAGAFAGFYVVMKVFSGYATATPAPDSWHQYGPATREAVHSPYSHVVSPGYWQANDPDPPGGEFPYLARDTTAFASAVASMAADSGVEWHLVTTFNEWGEGTNVEPSAEFGTAYLDILANDGALFGVHGARSASRTTAPLLAQAGVLTLHAGRATSRSTSPVLTQSGVVAVRAARSGARATAPPLSQATSLTVHPARSASRAIRPLLAQSSSVVVHGVRSEATGIAPTLTQRAALTVHGARTDSASSAPALTQTTGLAVNGVRSQPKATVPLVTQVGSGWPSTWPDVWPGQSTAFGVRDARSASHASTPLLAQSVTLTAHEARAVARATSPALAQAAAVLVRSAKATTRATSPLVTAQGVLTVRRAKGATRTTSPLLDQATAVTVARARSSTRASAPILSSSASLAVRGVRSTSRSTAPALVQGSPLLVNSGRAQARATSPLVTTEGVLIVRRAKSAPRSGSPLLSQTGVVIVHAVRSDTHGRTARIEQNLGTIAVAKARSETRASVPTLAAGAGILLQSARAATRTAELAVTQTETLTVATCRSATRTPAPRLVDPNAARDIALTGWLREPHWVGDLRENAWTGALRSD